MQALCRLRCSVRSLQVLELGIQRRGSISPMLRTTVRPQVSLFSSLNCTIFSLPISNRHLGPLLHLPATRLPQPNRRAGQIPRLQARVELGDMGVPRRGHRLPRLGGVRANSPLSLARPPSAAVCADPKHYGQHAQLDPRAWRRWGEAGRRCALQGGKGTQRHRRLQLPHQRGRVEDGGRAGAVHAAPHEAGVRGWCQYPKPAALGWVRGPVGQDGKGVCGAAGRDCGDPRMGVERGCEGRSGGLRG